MGGAVFQGAEREAVRCDLRRVHQHPGLHPVPALQAHLQLVGDEREVQVGLEVGDLVGVHVGDAETPDEALLLERGEGLGHFARVRQRVGAVQQQDVDVVGPQPGQALLDAPHDAGAAQVVHPGAVAVGEADPALGLYGDALAQAGRPGEHLAEHGLGLAVAVDVGVVERGDAAVEGRLHGGLGGVDVGGLVGRGVPTPAQPHASVDQPVLVGVRVRVRVRCRGHPGSVGPAVTAWGCRSSG